MKRNGPLRNLCVLVLLVLTALAVSGAPLWAEEIKAPAAAPAAASEEKPTGDFTVTAMSQYIWRGYELSRDRPLQAVVFSVGDFTYL